jgi:hypothetical protein
MQLALGTTFQFHKFSTTYFIAMRTKDFETQEAVHFFGGVKGQLNF